jgi:sorting nexin-25
MKLSPHNRQQVHQLRAALESAAAQQPGTIRQRSSMPTISITDPASPVRTPRANREKRATSISMHTDTRSFDAFLKSISTIRNVTEAKRLRNDIEREIRQVQARLEHEESKIRDNRAKDKATPSELKRLSSYQNRLQSARRKVDRKINKLNGTSPIMESTTSMGNIESEINSKEGPSLRDILSNPSPLSFYMEFMDRRNQARLVQFWLTVESFKNPLEEAESSEDEDGMGSFRLSATMQRLDCAAFATMKEDVGMIWSMFVDPKTVAEPVPLRPKLFENIRALVEADESNKVLLPLILEQARKSTFRGQKEVYETMLEDHFPAFRKTDLYRKAVIDLDKAAKKGSQVVQLGPDVASASFVALQTATSRQGSISPPALTSSASFGQTRWLNQLVGFSGMRFKESVPESPPRTPTAPRVRKRLSGLQPILPRVEPSPPSPEVNRPLVRSRSWSIDSNALPTGMSTPSRLDGSRQVLGFLIGEEEPQDDIGRSALFTIEDVPNDDRHIDYQEDVHDDEELVQVERMEAIQAALTSIIQRDEVSRGFPSKSEVRSRTSIDSASHAPSIASMDQNHQYDQWDPLGVVPKSPVMSEHSRPSFGTSYSRPSVDLGLGSSPNSVAFLQPKKVFDDTEEEKQDFLHRSLTSQSVPEMLAQRNPSIDGEPSLTPLDAQLSVEIARLGDLLVRLDEQDRILDRMIRAAELTGKESELYLLSRSQSDLRRELRATRFRKLQYEQQEIDYRLDPERTKLSIPSATILAEEAGKQIVRYVVEIQQYSMEGDFLQAWVVAKRYNEFWDLQHALKASPVVGRELKARGLDVPSKKLLPKLTDSFVDGRRVALQTYIQVSKIEQSSCYIF